MRKQKAFRRLATPTIIICPLERKKRNRKIPFCDDVVIDLAAEIYQPDLKRQSSLILPQSSLTSTSNESAEKEPERELQNLKKPCSVIFQSSRSDYDLGERDTTTSVREGDLGPVRSWSSFQLKTIARDIITMSKKLTSPTRSASFTCFEKGHLAGEAISGLFGGRHRREVEETLPRNYEVNQPPSGPCAYEIASFLQCAVDHDSLNECAAFQEALKGCKQRNGIP